jgi:hypothetical protein
MSTWQYFLTLILTNDILIFPPTLHLDFMVTKLAFSLHHHRTLSFCTVLPTFPSTFFTSVSTGFPPRTRSIADYFGTEVAGRNLGMRTREQEFRGRWARLARGTTQFFAFMRTGQDTCAGFFAS